MPPEFQELDAVFGVPDDRSRYLDFLPPIYEEQPFLGQFLLAFEGILAPIEQTVDNFDIYLDANTTPKDFLDRLAYWLGLSLDEKWPEEKRRAVVSEAAELFRRRGTRWSLIRHLEIYAGLTPEVEESTDRPHHFKVTLRVPKKWEGDRETVERIIQVNKPAHTTFDLEIKS
jgi:phage tail-like protein